MNRVAHPASSSASASACRSGAFANATAEPTLGDVVDLVEVRPQQGYAKIYPLGQECVVTGGGWIGIQIKAPANVNVRPYMTCEE